MNFQNLRQTLVNVAKIKAWKELIDTNMQVYLIVVLYVLLAKIQLSIIIPFGRILVITTSLALYITCTFLWNDYCDMPFDIKAGKTRVIHTMNRWLIIAIILFLFCSNISLIFLFANNLVFVLIYASAYFFAIFYSAYPIRFKERGIWGVLADVLCEKSLPVVLIFLFFEYVATDTLFCLILFSVFQLKIIFDHQMTDYKNDLVSGVNTYAVRVGAEKIQSLLTLFLRPFVAVLFIVFYLVLSFNIRYSVFFAGSLLIAYLMLKILVSKNVINRVNIRPDSEVSKEFVQKIPFYDGFISASLGLLLLFLAFLAFLDFTLYVTLLAMALISQVYIIRGHYFRILNSVVSILSTRFRSKKGQK